MTESIETSYHGHEDRYRIDIMPDSDPMNPRDWDNLGSVYCEHSRYLLGDRFASDPRDDDGQIDSKIAVWLPLYLYDHSGIAMSTGGFSDPWDSGCVGVIYVTRESVLREFGVKRISSKLRARVESILRGEVETYDSYLRGDVYGYVITDTITDSEIESCWGFYGLADCRSEAESVLASHMARNVEYPGVL